MLFSEEPPSCSIVFLRVTFLLNDLAIDGCDTTDSRSENLEAVRPSFDVEYRVPSFLIF